AGIAGHACPLSEPHAAMLGNLLAYEAFRAITGVMPAETNDAVIVQRLDTLDAVTEPLTPHPCCPHHAAAHTDGTTDPIRGITPGEPAMSGLPDVDDADESQKQLLEAAGRLVRPHVGVLVPTAAVGPFGPLNHDGTCVATAAGAGAGRSVAEALGAGLASALAFDALDRAIRGAEATAADPRLLAADPELDFLVRSAGNLRIEFELL